MVAVRRALSWLKGRGGVILVLLGAWVAVTAAGAGPDPDSTSWVGVPSLAWISYVLFGFMVLGAGFVLLAILLARGGPAPPPPKRKSMRPLLIAAAIVVALTIWRPNIGDDDDRQPVPPPAPAEDRSAAGDATPADDAADIAAIALILATAAGVLLWAHRRTDDPSDAADGPTHDSLTAALTPAVDRAADQLRLGTDPRSAILLAYDGLEKALDRHGHPRRLTETPSEHLDRVLGALAVDTAPLLRLAALYELARFSDHPLTTTDQREAAGALGRVGEQLAALA